MSNYLNFLYNNFGLNLWLTLTLSIIISIAILFMIIMLLILLLDSLYKPETSQYPFNFILDRVIPFIALFFPSIITFFLHPFETWFARITLLVLIHTFILAPIFHYWSKLRCWENKNDEISYGSWNHPRLYANIAIAMIYPLLWGVFFSLSRFLRLSTTYHIWNMIKSFPSDLIILIFISPYLIYWLLIILLYIVQIRQYLWNQCSSLLYSIHIYLLQYYFYFRFMELLYKSSFFINCVLTLNIAYKNQGPWWQHLTDYLYYNPKWITFTIFSIIMLEIILTKKIFYGIYILFIYTILYRIFSSYFAYAQTEFIYDCCLSDYCFLIDKNITPRYPQRFRFYFQDAPYYFGFEYEYTREQSDLFLKEINKQKTRWILRKKVSHDIHQDYVNFRILKKPNAPFCLRMAANYLHSHRVRWVHTERIVNTVYKYHSCTTLFARNIFDNIVLLNNSWGNLNHIQAAKISMQSYPNMYKSYNQTFNYHKKNFIGIQEENIPSNFVPLIKKGVIVEPYDEKNEAHKPVFLPQANPDTVFMFQGSQFIDKRTHVLTF